MINLLQRVSQRCSVDNIWKQAQLEFLIGSIYDVTLRKENEAMSHYANVIRNAAKLKDASQQTWCEKAKYRLDAIKEKQRKEEEEVAFTAMVSGDI